MLVPKGGSMLKKTAVVVVVFLVATPARADEWVFAQWMASKDAGELLKREHPLVLQHRALILRIKSKIKPMEDETIAGIISSFQSRFKEVGKSKTLYLTASYLEANLPKQGKVDLWEYSIPLYRQIK
jgi:hypothetical protein